MACAPAQRWRGAAASRGRAAWHAGPAHPGRARAGTRAACTHPQTGAVGRQDQHHAGAGEHHDLLADRVDCGRTGRGGRRRAQPAASARGARARRAAARCPIPAALPRPGGGAHLRCRTLSWCSWLGPAGIQCAAAAGRGRAGERSDHAAPQRKACGALLPAWMGSHPRVAMHWRLPARAPARPPPPHLGLLQLRLPLHHAL